MEEVTKTLTIEFEEPTKTLWLVPEITFTPPLSESEVASLLSAIDTVSLIIREEPISESRTLKLAETERGTYSLYVADSFGVETYITEKNSKLDGVAIFEQALSLARNRESTFRNSGRRN
jgi:hypothetical protein